MVLFVLYFWWFIRHLILPCTHVIIMHIGYHPRGFGYRYVEDCSESVLNPSLPRNCYFEKSQHYFI